MKLFSQKNDALPYKFYYTPILLLTIIGILDTTYLGFSHYKNYTDITFASFCALSNAINCDTVSQSPWSIFVGVPVALWGLAGYLLFFALLISVRKQSNATIALWSVLLVLGLIYSIAALVFAYISTVKIHAYCILCILSYLISFGLLFYSWIIWRRFGQGSFFTSFIRSFHIIFSLLRLRIFIIIFVILVLGLKTLIPHYWDYEVPFNSNMVQTGITGDGHPWIGAPKPEITIEEFTDYQCFQCYKMHFMLRKLITQFPDKIRLVHRHYPIDNEVNQHVAPQPFHVGSGRLALLAIAAGQQGKFWQMNDLLYSELRNKRTTFDLKSFAEKTGTDFQQLVADIQSQNTLKILENDIKAGLRHKISGTPTYVIDDTVYEGSIPSEIIKKISAKDKE